MAKTFHIKSTTSKNLARALLVALIFVCLIALLAACDKKDKDALSFVPIYDINMRYDSETHTLTARQEVLFSLPKNMSEEYAAFHTYANALSDSNDAIAISSVKINRQSVDHEICGDDNTLIKIPIDKKEELQSVTFEYAVSLKKTSSRLGFFDGGASLCFFYPSLAVYDGGWQEEGFSQIGDPFFCECADFYATLTLDADLSVACSGQASEAARFEDNGQILKTVEIVAEHIRDLGIVVGEHRCVRGTAHTATQDVEISYFYLTDASPQKALERAIRTVEAFSDAFGEYPYKTFSFAETPLDGAGGMEYGAFATVTPINGSYLDAVTHEIAHQWWYGAVGNDQCLSPWMDEGLSEFCTYYFYKLTGDPAEFSSAMADISSLYNDFVYTARTSPLGAQMQRPLASYASIEEYIAVTYQKGALLFEHLRSVVGEKKFVAAIKEYYSANKFAVATPSSLAAAFKTQGFDVAPIISGWVYCKEK